MKVFDLYAAYYDLLYRDKNYAEEADYVRALLSQEGPSIETILELGCGTGGHALQFADAGIRVHGIDFSASMIARAHERAQQSSRDIGSLLSFAEGDVRTYRDNSDLPYDVVVSLFHVMSYQTGNDDQKRAFETARAHLAPGGRFVFDFWYGPAVLSDRPRRVTKEVSDERIDVRRRATPKMHINDNCVEIQFDIDIASRHDARTEHVSERHLMRYLFLPEIRERLSSTGFRLQSALSWMTQDEPSDATWFACVVAEAE